MDFMMNPLSGPPMNPAIGMPTKNSAQTWERNFPGNQYVKYRTMPG